MSDRPPQWLFDQIMELPVEARGWALGFMCAGWLAGREGGAVVPGKESGAIRYAQCGACGCVIPLHVWASGTRCMHDHDGKTCGGFHTLLPPIDTPRGKMPETSDSPEGMDDHG